MQSLPKFHVMSNQKEKLSEIYPGVNPEQTLVPENHRFTHNFTLQLAHATDSVGPHNLPPPGCCSPLGDTQ